MGQILHRWVKPSVVGSNPPSLGHTHRRWVIPSVVGSYPPSLGHTLRRWVIPSVIGFYRPLLGSALCRWALPLVLCWFGAPSLGCTLDHWVWRSVVVEPSWVDGRCVLGVGCSAIDAIFMYQYRVIPKSLHTCIWDKPHQPKKPYCRGCRGSFGLLIGFYI